MTDEEKFQEALDALSGVLTMEKAIEILRAQYGPDYVSPYADPRHQFDCIYSSVLVTDLEKL